MMSQLIGIYGASGFGKEVMPLVRQHYSQLNQDNIVFIDDGGRLEQLDGYKVLSYQQFMNHTATQ